MRSPCVRHVDEEILAAHALLTKSPNPFDVELWFLMNWHNAPLYYTVNTLSVAVVCVSLHGPEPG